MLPQRLGIGRRRADAGKKARHPDAPDGDGSFGTGASAQTAKLDPQPHLAVACGLLILKAEPIRSAL